MINTDLITCHRDPVREAVRPFNRNDCTACNMKIILKHRAIDWFLYLAMTRFNHYTTNTKMKNKGCS